MSGPELLGPYTLCQPEGVFPLGEDALALGSFATVKRGWRVCDLGTGSGCLLLLLAGREEELRLSGVDRDPAAAQAARDNLARNGLPGEIWTGDWRAVPFAPGSFDLVISNPPYYARGSGGDGGPARMEGEGDGLAPLCRVAARLLRNGGDLPCASARSGWPACLPPWRGAAWSPSGCNLPPTGRTARPAWPWWRRCGRGGPGWKFCPSGTGTLCKVK